MSDLNRVILMGNLTRDPEVRYTPQGTAVGNLSIASNRKRKLGDSWKEETLFIDAVAWGNRAEVCKEYLKKGSKVLVEGRLQLREWEDPSGQKRAKVQIVVEDVHFMDGRKPGHSGQTGYSGSGTAPQASFPKQGEKPQGAPPQRAPQPRPFQYAEPDFEDIPF